MLKTLPQQVVMTRTMIYQMSSLQQSGDTFIAGTFDSPSGANYGATTLTSGALGGDALLMRCTASGTVIWAVVSGTDAISSALHGVATDAATDGAYIAGMFTGIESTWGTTVLTGSYMDGIVGQVSGQGTGLWTVAVGGDNTDSLGQLALDGAGGAFSAGLF